MRKLFLLFLCSMFFYAVNLNGQSVEVVVNGDFMTDDLTTSFQFTSNANEELVPSGRKALKIESPERLANDWGLQMWVKIDPPALQGEVYKFKMDVRSDKNCSFAAQAHFEPTDYTHWDVFGSVSVTPKWTTFERTFTVTAAMVGTAPAKGSMGAIAFNLGQIETSLYIANVSLVKVVDGEEGEELIVNGDFQGDDLETSFQFTDNAEEEIIDLMALKIASEERLGNDYSLQMWVKFDPPAKLGEEYIFKLDLRSDKNCTFGTQAHYVPTDYVHWDMFGNFNVTPEWTSFERKTTINASHVAKGDLGAIAFNLGQIETTLYIANVSLVKFVPEFPTITITTQPSSNLVFIEGEVSGNLIVAANVTMGVTPTYQWYATEDKDEEGEEIDGATNATFAIPTGLKEGTYFFYCVVSAEDAESKKSNVSTIVIRTVGHGDVEVHPAPITNVFEGHISANLSIEVIEKEDGGDITYQWFVNSVPRSTGGTAVVGATEATLPIPADLKKGSYYFYCAVSVTVEEEEEGEDGEEPTVKTTVTTNASNTGKVVVWAGFMIADFEEDEVGKTYPGFINSGSVGGIVEVALSPHDNSAGYPDPNAGPGKVLHIHGTQADAAWGLTGNQIFPEFEVKLPEGKTLGDYEFFSVDAYFYRGTDGGGTNADGAGWYGWGAPGLRIVDGDKQATLENFPGNMREMGTATLNEQGIEGDWQPRTWARGIKFALSNNPALPEEFKSLNEFKIRFGSRSGAVNYVIDNVALLESRVVTSYDFENYALGARLPIFATGGTADNQANNIIEVVADPDEESGNVLLIHGTNLNPEYGEIGIQLVPEFYFVLPQGKTLGDYTSLQLDMRFTTGVDNGGTNEAGTGWFGGGMIINIDGGFVNAEGAPASTQTGFSNANSLGANVANTWARGITMSLINMNLSAEYRALTEFKLRVGTTSGATKYWMDNVILVESTADHGEILRHPAEVTNVTETRINAEISILVQDSGDGEITYQWFSNNTNSNEDGTEIAGATEAAFSIPKNLTAGTYYYYCVVSVDDEVSDVSNVATVVVAEYSDCIFTDDFESYATIYFNYDLTSHPAYEKLVTGLSDNRDQMTYLQYAVQLYGDASLSDLSLVNAWFVIKDPTEANPDRTRRIPLGDYTWINNDNQKGWDLFSDDEDLEEDLEEILEGIADGSIEEFVIAFTAGSIEEKGGMNGIGFILNSNGGTIATGWSTHEDYYPWDGKIDFDELYEMALDEDDDEYVTFEARTPGMISATQGWNSWSGDNQRRQLSEKGDGYGGEGYSLKFTNSQRTGDAWGVQLTYELPFALAAGEDFEWSFWVRAELEEGSVTTVNGDVQNPSGYVNNGDFTPFELTSEWQLVKPKVTISANASAAARHRPMFNFGHVVGTIWFDDVRFCYSGPIVRITTQPVVDITVGEGTITEDHKLTVAATITQGATLNYQWFVNTTASNVGGTAVPGATSAEFALPENLTQGTYYYYCVVGGNVVDDRATDPVPTRVATVEVLCATCPVITIVTNPAANTTVTGVSTTLTVEATVTLGAELSYQWYSNTTNSNEGGTVITGATSAEFTTPVTAGTHYYYCVVNAIGKEGDEDADPKTTTVATVIVNAVITITTPPAGGNVNVGSAHSMSIVAAVTEGATLTYQWYLNDTNDTATGEPVTGATNPTLASSTTLPAGTYYYYCVVSANHNAVAVTSETAAVVIQGGGTDVAEVFGVDFKVYPNPFTGALRIEGVEGATLRVVNSTGAVVFVQLINNADETVNLEHLPTGMYILRLEKDNQVKAITVIKN